MELLLGGSAIAAFYFVYRTIKLQKQVEMLATKLIASKYKPNSSDQKIADDSFLKFLSDSREWAFDYITDVQEATKLFKDKVDPVINHFDKYGDVVHSAHYESMKTISDAYKELIKILPEDNNN